MEMIQTTTSTAKRAALQLNILSAESLRFRDNLKAKNKKLKPYVVASVITRGCFWKKSTRLQEKFTNIDKKGCTKLATWNCPLRFLLNDVRIISGIFLLFEVYDHHTFMADKLIGQVKVPVQSLLASVEISQENYREYVIRTPSGDPRGVLKVSHMFVPLGGICLPVCDVPLDRNSRLGCTYSTLAIIIHHMQEPMVRDKFV